MTTFAASVAADRLGHQEGKEDSDRFVSGGSLNQGEDKVGYRMVPTEGNCFCGSGNYGAFQL